MTYGQKINRIKKSVAKMPVPMQLYVLEHALKDVLGAKSIDLVKVDGRLISDWPAYQNGMAAWNEQLKRLGV